MAITAYSDLPSLKFLFDARKDLYNAADAATAKTTPIQSGAKVANWENQHAAVGSAVTQATDANRPYYAGGRLGGVGPGVDFPGNGLAGGGNKRLSTTALGGAGVLDNRSSTMLAVVTMAYSMFDAPGGTDKYGYIGCSTDNVNDDIGLGTYQGTLRQWNSAGVGTNVPVGKNSLLWVPSTPAIVAYSADTTTLTFAVNGKRATTTVAANVGVSSGRIYIGGTSTNINSWLGRVHMLLGSSAVYTETQFNDAINFAANDWGICITPRLNIVPIGDSLTAGQTGGGATAGANIDTWPMILSALIDGGSGHRLCNCGVPSMTADQWAANFDAYAGGAFDPTCFNVAVVFAGINDIAAGTAEAAIATDLAAICSAARAKGAGYVILCTLPQAVTGSISAGEETNRTDLNTLIRANYQAYGADALADLDTEITATVDYASDLTTNDTLYISADADATRIHFTSIMHGWVARIIHRIIKPLVSNVAGVTQWGGGDGRGRASMSVR